MESGCTTPMPPASETAATSSGLLHGYIAPQISGTSMPSWRVTGVSRRLWVAIIFPDPCKPFLAGLFRGRIPRTRLHRIYTECGGVLHAGTGARPEIHGAICRNRGPLRDRGGLPRRARTGVDRTVPASQELSQRGSTA